MTSAARIAANRANARHSTGPRTARGKTASSQNACKHGFRSASAPHTNPEFEALLDAFRSEHLPTTPAEESCVGTIATAVWKIHEIDRLDYEAFATRLIAGRFSIGPPASKREQRLCVIYSSKNAESHRVL
jgi:hypothetical protein